MPKPEINIEFSITAWSKALVMHHETLAGKLSKAGVDKSETYTARQIFTALHGEKDASIIRQNNAKAEQLEKENRMRDGELVELPAAERIIWSELLMPLKQEMDLMPNRIGLLLGGESEKILLDWVENVKRRFYKEKL